MPAKTDETLQVRAVRGISGPEGECGAAPVDLGPQFSAAWRSKAALRAVGRW